MRTLRRFWIHALAGLTAPERARKIWTVAFLLVAGPYLAATLACAHVKSGVLQSPAYEAVHLEMSADHPFLLGPGKVRILVHVRGDIPGRAVTQWLCPEQSWDFGDMTGATRMEETCTYSEPPRYYTMDHKFTSNGIFKVALEMRALNGGYRIGYGVVYVTVGSPE